MHIVKLGGSLFHTAELQSWLTLIAEASMAESMVIVPGGGPFADSVRQAQQLYQFDDHYAHHMALLAMAQYGLLLQALLPQAKAINSPADVSSKSPLSIWLPDNKMLQVDELIQSWEITSDSLALWFAQQLPGSRLSLIKCVHAETSDIAILSQNDIIDQGFNALFQQQPIPTQIIHFQHPKQFPDNGLGLR